MGRADGLGFSRKLKFSKNENFSFSITTAVENDTRRVGVVTKCFFARDVHDVFKKRLRRSGGGGSSSRDRGFSLYGSLYLDWMIIIRKNLPPFSSSLVRLEHIVDGRHMIQKVVPFLSWGLDVQCPAGPCVSRPFLVAVKNQIQLNQ